MACEFEEIKKRLTPASLRHMLDVMTDMVGDFTSHRAAVYFDHEPSRVWRDRVLALLADVGREIDALPCVPSFATREEEDAWFRRQLEGLEAREE